MNGELTAAMRPALIGLVLGLTFLPSQSADAQEDLRIGNFHVVLRIDPITDEDESLAIVFPNGGATDGTLMWGCGGELVGLMAGIQLNAYTHSGAAKQVVWRFDRDRPDSTVLHPTSDGRAWFLRDQDVAAFTIRAKTAARLVIRVIEDAPSHRTTDYIYDLSGSDAALNRLTCARNPRLLGIPVGTMAVGEAVAADTGMNPSPPPVTDETYELSEVEELPRPTNTVEFRAALLQNYPPLLLDAGVSGTVQVHFRVLENGHVDAASLTVASSTHDQFNDAAFRAVRLLLFRPARVNGRPVKVWVEMPIQFNPNASP